MPVLVHIWMQLADFCHLGVQLQAVICASPSLKYRKMSAVASNVCCRVECDPERAQNPRFTLSLRKSTLICWPADLPADKLSTQLTLSCSCDRHRLHALTPTHTGIHQHCILRSVLKPRLIHITWWLHQGSIVSLACLQAHMLQGLMCTLTCSQPQL